MLSIFSEKTAKTAAPFFASATFLLVLSLCVTSFAYSAAPITMTTHVGTAASPLVPSVATYPVKLSASPKTQTIAPGGNATVSIKEKNTGTATFTVTGCVTEVKEGTKYESIGCTEKTIYTIAAGKTVKSTLTITTTSAISAGTYDFKFYVTGTVGSTSYDSKSCTFSVTVS
jgi:uncharacterized membrane protein